ncbi:hypothetical protein E2C01_098471 [Portunus trituberculatus]|uniref:Uncharacterized protein n=1 Tax=Portunus trituberculatus TaxID=210409 RepID=A0A5B7KEA4_PORTR|nr:hypothetical protein [Portunus trituberculatus]
MADCSPIPPTLPCLTASPTQLLAPLQRLIAAPPSRLSMPSSWLPAPLQLSTAKRGCWRLTATLNNPAWMSSHQLCCFYHDMAVSTSTLLLYLSTFTLQSASQRDYKHSSTTIASPPRNAQQPTLEYDHFWQSLFTLWNHV